MEWGYLEGSGVNKIKIKIIKLCTCVAETAAVHMLPQRVKLPTAHLKKSLPQNTEFLKKKSYWQNIKKVNSPRAHLKKSIPWSPPPQLSETNEPPPTEHPTSNQPTEQALDTREIARENHRLDSSPRPRASRPLPLQIQIAMDRIIAKMCNLV